MLTYKHNDINEFHQLMQIRSMNQMTEYQIRTRVRVNGNKREIIMDS